MKVKYKTIENYRGKDFDLEINELLGLGWELYGSPYCMTNGTGDCGFCQALINKEAQENDLP